MAEVLSPPQQLLKQSSLRAAWSSAPWQHRGEQQPASSHREAAEQEQEAALCFLWLPPPKACIAQMFWSKCSVC